MRGKFITLHTNGTRSVRELTATPELEELQKAVGGYLEQIPYFLTFEGERCVAFCNEEGKTHLLPVNAEATNHWQKSVDIVAKARNLVPMPLNDVLVGDIAIIIGDDELMAEL